MVRTTLIVCALLAGSALARAAETEVRQFNVSVDGKPSGQYTMTFTKQDNGTLHITCDAHVKVKVLGVTAYHYDYMGKEVWKAVMSATLTLTWASQPMVRLPSLSLVNVIV